MPRDLEKELRLDDIFNTSAMKKKLDKVEDIHQMKCNGECITWRTNCEILV